jgi:hypothetical protein
MTVGIVWVAVSALERGVRRAVWIQHIGVKSVIVVVVVVVVVIVVVIVIQHIQYHNGTYTSC